MPSAHEVIAKEIGKTVAEFYYATSLIRLIVNCYSNQGHLEIRGFYSPQMIIKDSFQQKKNTESYFNSEKITVQVILYLVLNSKLKPPAYAFRPIACAADSKVCFSSI